MLSPLFIVFEGVDGAGTTTQCQHLCDRIRAAGHCLVQTREPGGTSAGERIRQLVLDPELAALDDIAELLLYAASRRQHVAELIKPALKSNKPVISDRYAQSSVAYQGIARGLGQELVDSVNHIATGGLVPDLTLILDLDTDIALQRRQSRSPEPLDRLEAEGLAFQQAVRQAFRDLADGDPHGSVLLAADVPIEDLAGHVYDTLLTRFPQFPFKSSTGQSTP